jgi:GNAT superfamily N-acetyltransferase
MSVAPFPKKPTTKQRIDLANRLSHIVTCEWPREIILPKTTIRIDFELMRWDDRYGRMVRITAHSGCELVGFVQRITADEHFAKAISVGGVRVNETHRRMGIATALYDIVEELGQRIGARLVPSDLLSDDAKAFWAARQNRTGSAAT